MNLSKSKKPEPSDIHRDQLSASTMQEDKGEKHELLTSEFTDQTATKSGPNQLKTAKQLVWEFLNKNKRNGKKKYKVELKLRYKNEIVLVKLRRFDVNLKTLSKSERHKDEFDSLNMMQKKSPNQKSIKM